MAVQSLPNAAGDVPKGLFLEKPSPLSFAKAIKNSAELDGMREAHLRDSVALAETLHHLEQEVCIVLPHAPHLMPDTSERIRGSRVAWRKPTQGHAWDTGLSAVLPSFQEWLYAFFMHAAWTSISVMPACRLRPIDMQTQQSARH